MLSKFAFENAETILEVHKLMNLFKAQGEDTIEVNQLAAVRKKELVQKASSTCKYNRLPKLVSVVGIIKKQSTSKFMLKIENMAGNEIHIEAGNTVVIK